jgi:hypothetical protein
MEFLIVIASIPLGYATYRTALLITRYVFTTRSKRELHQQYPLKVIGFSEAQSTYYVAETSPFQVGMIFLLRGFFAFIFIVTWASFLGLDT